VWLEINVRENGGMQKNEKRNDPVDMMGDGLDERGIPDSSIRESNPNTETGPILVRTWSFFHLRVWF
jgi:hypothetical protein